MNEYLASEHFTNTFGSSGLSDLLEPNLSMACQRSLEMDLDYICPDPNTQTPRGATCGPLTPPKESNPSNQQPPSKNISLPAPDGEFELRPASHKSKNCKRHSATPSNQVHARECHNLVEKHYRARLKTQFERLLAVLPAAQGRSLAGRDTAASLGQVLSKGQVLDMARNRILELEGKIEFILNMKQDDYHVS
ncbi:Allergen Fus c 3 [Fusarium oxysporum f. sp. rapae]|uniref:Allergen Fus c 3 n=1 Tax=Fusarium oxysporum f. sp. rapae TaxID=485398 RepID=A0A8J5TXX5_FUSOX|nr:Allergen Fus c 3 [Fusarium oxysporum f. sp. rapae]